MFENYYSGETHSIHDMKCLQEKKRRKALWNNYPKRIKVMLIIFFGKLTLTIYVS